jgi:hypothetical protein
MLLLLLSYKMYVCVTSAFHGQSDLKSTSLSLPRKVPIRIYIFKTIQQLFSSHNKIIIIILRNNRTSKST